MHIILILSLKLVGDRGLVAQSARALLWHDEVTGSSTPGYIVLTTNVESDE